MDDNHKNYRFLTVKPWPNDEEGCEVLKNALPSILGDTYIVSKEWATKKNWHCHAVFHSLEHKKTEFRDKLYGLLKSLNLFDENKVGNATYSDMMLRNFEHGTIYTTKDQDILYDGHQTWKDFVEECQKKSYGKPKSIKEFMDDLYLLFENDKINERELWIKMTHGRAQFPDIKTRYADIDALVETFKIKKYGEEYVIEIWENRNMKLS